MIICPDPFGFDVKGGGMKLLFTKLANMKIET